MAMMRRALAALIAAFFLASAAAGAQGAEDLKPALFVARDRDSTLYLFGTIHVRHPGADWGGPAAHAALAQAEEFWTELEMSPAADARAAADVARLGLSATPLSSHLTPAQNARLGAALARVGAPPNALEGMTPWFAGLMLTILPIVRAGYDPNNGVDRQIDAAADAQGKTARWFETSEQQLSFFADLSMELQVQMLMEGADAAIEGIDELGVMEAAWARGDLRTLERMVIDETREGYPELYQVLFVERNRAWTETLVREMQGSGVDFVAVGAGHLLGPDGLVRMLRARGAHVKRVRQ